MFCESSSNEPTPSTSSAKGKCIYTTFVQVIFRPERAQYLAQGKRRANRQGRAALGIDVPVKFSRPNGARENCSTVSCPFRAAKWFVCLATQGGGEYALPWARSCAPSGRNCVDTFG